MRAALAKELGTIVDEPVALDASLKPRLSGRYGGDARRTVRRPDAFRILRERVLAIERNAQRVEDSLTPQMLEEAYVVKAIRNRYVPDTLAAYRHAHSLAPEAAQQMLEEQLSTIDEEIREAAVAVVSENMDLLRANGAFLKARFRNPKTYEIDVKGH